MIVIIGAGLTGITAARCLAEVGHKVAVWECSGEIGGAAHDFRHESGQFIHTHGPHIFHSSSEEAYAFLGRFTNWQAYAHRVRAVIDGKLVPVPFNFESIDLCFSPALADKYKAVLESEFVGIEELGIDKLLDSPVPILRQLGLFVYEKLFYSYTKKQWGVSPEALGASVLGRVPVRLSYRDGYFSDPFQALPGAGYTAMLERMLDHDHITLYRNCSIDMLRIKGSTLEFDGKKHQDPVVYTGSLDVLFNYKYNKLPYRTLRFETTLEKRPRQSVAVVNHPEAPGYTRTTEYGHFYPEEWGTSIVVREYPLAWCENLGKPQYYPLPLPEASETFEKYQRLALEIETLFPAGRLGRYRYINMDAAVIDGFRAAKEVTAFCGK